MTRQMAIVREAEAEAEAEAEEEAEEEAEVGVFAIANALGTAKRELLSLVKKSLLNLSLGVAPVRLPPALSAAGAFLALL